MVCAHPINWDEMANNMYAQDLADENDLLDVDDDDVPNILGKL